MFEINASPSSQVQKSVLKGKENDTLMISQEANKCEGRPGVKGKTTFQEHLTGNGSSFSWITHSWPVGDDLSIQRPAESELYNKRASLSSVTNLDFISGFSPIPPTHTKSFPKCKHFQSKEYVAVNTIQYSLPNGNGQVSRIMNIEI